MFKFNSVANVRAIKITWNVMKYLTGLFLLFISSASIASDQTDADFFVSAGLTTGGDTFAETTMGLKLKAGGLIYLSLGSRFNVSQNISLQGSFGYHFDALDTENGSADFNRFFIEILPFYNLSETFRIGAGVTYLISPEYTDSWDNIAFADTAGPILELNWRGASEKIWWGLRYSDIEFETETLNGYTAPPVKFSGSYIGLLAHFYF